MEKKNAEMTSVAYKRWLRPIFGTNHDESIARFIDLFIEYNQSIIETVKDWLWKEYSKFFMLFFHDILTIYTICHISVGNGTATSIGNGIGTIWILFGKTYISV